LWSFKPIKESPDMPRSILIVFAHPALQKSRVGTVLATAAGQVEGVHLHDLYETYPDFDIAIKREQSLLEAHDAIVLQHPFYWYSVPALLKEWFDLVLQHGWAYGADGHRLQGKACMTAITCGGGADAYSSKGMNRFPIRDFLAPVEQTARLCGMDWLGPFVVHGTHTLSDTAIQQHAVDYRRVLEAIRDGRLDRKQADRRSHINLDLQAVIKEG